jgi:hypothetical protein
MKLSVKVFPSSRFIYFGGSDKVTYAGGSHLDQEGIVGQSKMVF